MTTYFPLLIGLLGLGPVAHAQLPTPPAYRNLVLEGGGIRGIAYGGALQELESHLNPTQPTDWPRTISINFLEFSPRIKRISAARKQQLMDSGRAGGQAFFAAPGKAK